MKRFAIVISVVVLVFATTISAQTTAPQAGPEYNVLDAWAGEWNIQAEVKDSPSGPAHRVDWTLKGKRILGGFFLEVRHISIIEGTVQNGLEVTGYDPTKKACITHIFFDDGSWVISTPTFINDRTCIEIGTEYFPDGKVVKWRNTWNFSPDWMSLSVKGEDEKDGTWWTSMEGEGIRPKAK
jgi:Protein of unknown function (DUF1579)